MIEVILLERIERLGQLGQVVKVRPGFARNFLLPQNKALRATKANMEQFEKQRAELEARNAAERAKAEAAAAKMDGMKLVIIRQASETGQLFGSVASRDIAEVSKDAIVRSQIMLDAPIKTLGIFSVKVKLHPEVYIKVSVNVARTQEEAVVQAEKGAAVIKAAAKAAEAASEAAAVAAIGEQPVAAAEGEEAAKPAKKAKAKKAEAAAEGAEAANDEAKPAKKAKAKKAAAE